MRVGNLRKAIVLNVCDKERSDLVDGDVVVELIFFLTVVVERLAKPIIRQQISVSYHKKIVSIKVTAGTHACNVAVSGLR
jgi:hypothetical protein